MACGIFQHITEHFRKIGPLQGNLHSFRNLRLDQRGEGAGLGLAIVQDVLDAYGWRLDLARSELGGLKAAIAPKEQGRYAAVPDAAASASFPPT